MAQFIYLFIHLKNLSFKVYFLAEKSEIIILEAFWWLHQNYYIFTIYDILSSMSEESNNILFIIQ